MIIEKTKELQDLLAKIEAQLTADGNHSELEMFYRFNQRLLPYFDHIIDVIKEMWSYELNSQTRSNIDRDTFAKTAENTLLKTRKEETGDTKCEQCEHYDISQGVYTVECYSCNRYCGDLFTLRAGAIKE